MNRFKQLTYIILLPFIYFLLPVSVHAQFTEDEINHTLAQELIYIDQVGTIRILDLTSPLDAPVYLWTSPISGWRSFATGDFNNDGDHEIVAIGGGQTDGLLAVYDPSSISLEDELLYTKKLAGEPTIVAAGDFDLNVPGHEILYDYILDEADRPKPDHRIRLVVMRNSSQPVDGRSWSTFIERNMSFGWDRVAVGNVDQQGIDEVALANTEEGLLRVYRLDQGVEHFFSHASEVNPWNDVALGNIHLGARTELVGVRTTRASLSTLFVFDYDHEEEEYVDGYNDRFQPGPHTVFLADINGSGDDEIFMLRNVPQNAANNPPRLFMRNLGNDDSNPFEITLNRNNLFVGATGGDIDGDGKDEIIVTSDSLIRIFTEPDQETAQMTYRATSHGRRLGVADVGNLNYTLQASQSQLNATLIKGTESEPINIFLNNITNQRPISFTAALERDVPWATLNVDINRTPATLSVNFNATNLAPGSYDNKLLVNSDIIEIPIQLTVEPNMELQASQNPVRVTLAGGTQSKAIEVTLENSRTELPIDFTAEVVGNSSWVTLTVDTNQTPATLSMLFDATTFLPGIRSDRILIKSSDADILNPEYTINLELVVDSAISTETYGRGFTYDAPCEEPLEPMTQTIRIEGTQGQSYTVGIIGEPNPSTSPLGQSLDQNLAYRSNRYLSTSPQIDWPSAVPWLDASSERGIVPEDLILVIDPSKREPNDRDAGLSITVGNNLSPEESRRIVPIYFVCAQYKIYMPQIAR